MTNQNKDAPEKWAAIVGYEKLYAVSSIGRIKNLKSGSIIVPKCNQSGYPRFDLCKDGKKKSKCVHALVAEAFFGPKEGRWVNHINSIRSDNRLENLEYVNERENVCHGKCVRKMSGTSFHKLNRKWSSRITINGKRIALGYFDTQEEAHAAYVRKLGESGLENKYARK